VPWIVLRPNDMATNMANLDVLPDNSILASGDQTKSDIYGVGKIALASLLTGAVRAQPAHNPLAARQPHFRASAKAVIHLFMAGAPSQRELFDFKPEWTRPARG
jgi:hypothetical protein